MPYAVPHPSMCLGSADVTHPDKNRNSSRRGTWVMALSAAYVFATVLAILVSCLHSLSISPGKYCRLPDLDCMLISIAAGVSTTVEYHTHSIETESRFSPSGELTNLEVFWDRYRHTHGSLRARTSSQFAAFNESHLIESFGDTEFVWERVSDVDAKQKLVEIAVLTKKARNDEVFHNDAFIQHAFSSNTTPVYYWDGIYGVNECPTFDVRHLDKDHSASKVIGIVLAHYRIWQDFYRRYRNGDPESRILILEADVRCSRDFCGDIAIEEINRTNKDLRFVGWCRVRNKNMSAPPLCAHAYAISVKAAEVLLKNVFPCLDPVDGQIFTLCLTGLLSWTKVNAEENRLLQTSGLIRQVGW